MKKTELITLAKLRDDRERVEKQAREHALRSALAYYFQGGCESEQKQVDSLRKLVFGNWLQQHAFTEKFEPLLGIGR